MSLQSKKGFTLIELVATVAILLLLTTVAVVSVTGVLKDSKKDINNVSTSEIKKAARNYVVDKLKDNPNNFNICTKITKEDLDNYLDKNSDKDYYLCAKINNSGKTIIEYYVGDSDVSVCYNDCNE